MLEFLKRFFAKPAPASGNPHGQEPKRTASEDAVVPVVEKIRPTQVNPASITNSPYYRIGYPSAYSMAKKKPEILRPEIFEPALKHFSRAFRLGYPFFQDTDKKDAWLDTRSQVADHLLRIVNGSRWNAHLVLRGSFLLKAWLGDAAREPGDIDWVFIPANVGLDDPLSRELFDGLVQLASEFPTVGRAKIEIADITMDDIWTYERASGRRIVFPWTAEGLPGGEIQMDVVFGEELFTDPVSTPIPLSAGENLVVLGASKELSLAWKLLWLETDMLPQGKDLYDATLLAEQTRLSPDLLNRVLRSGGLGSRVEFGQDAPKRWYVDWKNFQLEYPWVEGEAEEWQIRLSLALAPTFTE